MKTVVIIHTTPVTIESVGTLIRKNLREQDPRFEVRICNLLDDSLLPDLGGDAASVEGVNKRVSSMLGSAELIGADAVMSACSSIGTLIDDQRDRVAFPLLRIDRPMIRAAVKQGGRIAVAATLRTTLEPTMELLKTESARIGTSPVLDPVLIQDAGKYLLAGDATAYDEAVRAAAEQALEFCDLLLLAQASMARIIPALSEKQRKRILTSPESGTAALCDLLRSL